MYYVAGDKEERLAICDASDLKDKERRRERGEKGEKLHGSRLRQTRTRHVAQAPAGGGLPCKDIPAVATSRWLIGKHGKHLQRMKSDLQHSRGSLFQHLRVLCISELLQESDKEQIAPGTKAKSVHDSCHAMQPYAMPKCVFLD